MDPVEVVREILAWLWLAALGLGLGWAIVYLARETRDALREWRS